MNGSINFDGTLTGSIAGGGGGGGVEDVTLGGSSVVNAQGVAELPAYPEVPVEDVTLGGSSVVNAQGVAELPEYPEVPEHIVTDVTVAGESVVNPNTGVAQIVLPEPINYVRDVKVNGDSVVDNMHVANIETLDNYSTSEYATNKRWINGKIIYRKVFVFENVSAGDHNFDTNISNVDEVINQYGTFIRHTSDFTWTYSLNSVNEVSITDLRFVVLARYKNTENKIYVYVATGVYNPITKLTFIMEYTKNEV